MKILVAEDDRTSALTLERLLKKSGYQVMVTRDGAEALEAIHKQRFDALLTDWLMPRVDGIQLTHEARIGPNPVPIVIFITILDSPQAKTSANSWSVMDTLSMVTCVLSYTLNCPTKS